MKPRSQNLLCYLYWGGTNPKVMEERARDALDYIRERRDCADFRVAYFVRVLYSYGDILPKSLRKEMEELVLHFPFRDQGGHDMCTWTENHRLYLYGSEYLLAQQYPSCRALKKSEAAAHIRKWAEWVLRYGFAEWNSNNYYSETLAALSNIYEFAKDSDIRELMRRCLELLLKGILAQTIYNGGYIYNPACARAYVDNKISSRHGNYLDPQLKTLFGEPLPEGFYLKEKEICFIAMLKNTGFSVPKEWLKIGGEREIALRQGLDIRDYRKEGFDGYSEDKVCFAMEAGAISDYRLIQHNMRYLCQSGLIDNGMLSALRPFRSPVLWRTGILRFLKSLVLLPWDQMAMEEGRTYTYTNGSPRGSYSVSAAENYHVGKPSVQQNVLALSLSYDISLCLSSPFKGPEKTGSPDYWIGSADTPRVAACKNVAMAQFKPGTGRTHLFFPMELFDEVDLSRLDEGILYACAQGVNVMIRTNPGARFARAQIDKSLRQDGKIPQDAYTGAYDLLNEARGAHFYVFELDNTMDFRDFQKRETIVCKKGRKLLYYGDNSYLLPYRGAFLVNGKEFKPAFARPDEFVL